MSKFVKSVRNIRAYLNARGLAVAAGGAGSLVAPFAFAGGGGGLTFDTATVTAAIATMLAAGILIYTAWVAGKWTLKAIGLIGK